MIRDYKQSDIEEIIRLYTLEYLAMPEEIESLERATKILVYEDNGIQGFIRLARSGTYCYVEMGIASNEQIKPVGLALWEEANKFLVENSVDFIEIYHVKDNLNWQELFDEIGFEYWYSINRFEYKGDKFKEPEIYVQKYEDSYYEDKIRLESEAFTALRKENDIKPYNWYLSASKEALESSRKETLQEKEYIYLFLENEKIVGVSMVKNAEIELFFVSLEYQGKGYGRKILEYTVNRGLEQNEDGVYLNALQSNEKAQNIYRRLGFRVIQSQDARRLAR
ncbi:GNAT family N-acetyltransferase [Clostridiaceae bacterium M8S5]|nr:GNAT family N-acetyltransferase [Clostridiaceae bacterium M8S5]